MSSWPQPLKSWSLRESRGDSAGAIVQHFEFPTYHIKSTGSNIKEMHTLMPAQRATYAPMPVHMRCLTGTIEFGLGKQPVPIEATTIKKKYMAVSHIIKQEHHNAV